MSRSLHLAVSGVRAQQNNIFIASGAAAWQLWAVVGFLTKPGKCGMVPKGVQIANKRKDLTFL